ncbi:MAG: isochorismatase family protein [Clostridia bacterium]|nr:isochorismatase family protein [Clostridia bacterium]MDD4685924.1 isochorismatase family protein [Clostridia bacterium]
MKNNLLVVVDMVNGFINEGPLADKNINKITGTVVNEIKKAIQKKYTIIAFKDCHMPDDAEFKDFPPHCIGGTSQSELIPEVKSYENNLIVIEKNTTNGFNTKAFKNLVKGNIWDNVLVVGCCTDICVLQFATNFNEFNKNHNRPTKIFVAENGVYTFDNSEHNAEKNHQNALQRMQDLGISVVSLKEKTNFQMHNEKTR